MKPAYLKHQNFNSDVFFINIFNPKSPRILVHQLLGKLLSWEFLHGQKKSDDVYMTCCVHESVFIAKKIHGDMVIMKANWKVDGQGWY